MSDMDIFEKHLSGKIISIYDVEITVVQRDHFFATFTHHDHLYSSVECRHLFMRGDLLYLIPITSSTPTGPVFEAKHLLSTQSKVIIDQLPYPIQLRERIKNMIEHQLY